MEDLTDIEKTECGTSGDFLSWKNASLQWILKGNAKRLHNQKDPCDRESAVEIFSEGFLSGVACMEHCQKLGSRSPPVRTVEELQNLTSATLTIAIFYAGVALAISTLLSPVSLVFG